MVNMLPKYRCLIYRCCQSWSRNIKVKSNTGVMNENDLCKPSPRSDTSGGSKSYLTGNLDGDNVKIQSSSKGTFTCLAADDEPGDSQAESSSIDTDPSVRSDNNNPSVRSDFLSFDPSIVKVFVRNTFDISCPSSSESWEELCQQGTSKTSDDNSTKSHLNTNAALLSQQMLLNPPQGISALCQQGTLRPYHGLSIPTGNLTLGPLAPGSRKQGSVKREVDVEPNCQMHFHSAMKRYRTDDEDMDPYNIIKEKPIRKWETTHFGHIYAKNPGKNDFEFSLMTYNVLAQNLLTDNIYLYRDVRDHLLEWDFRKQRLVQEIKYHNPDIMCLQEVHRDHYQDFFIPKLQALGYSSEYQQRTGDKLDGCAVFYKKDKFHLEKCHHVKYYHQQWPILDRDNVGLIVKLKPKNKKKDCDCVCVANTHLLYNPRRGDIKLAQLILLLAEIDKVSCASKTSSSHCPVIMCGDFNSQPYSDIYKLIVQGHLRYEGLVSSYLSGQREGFSSKNIKLLAKDFFPPKLNISDQCRYIDLQRHDIQMSQQMSECVSSASETVGESKMSQQVSECDISTSEGIEQSQCQDHQFIVQNSGSLSHRLNFESAYKHKIWRQGHWENGVTSQHRRGSCILDYIFYSVQCQETRNKHGKLKRQNKEGKLKLLGCLGLLSHQEIESMGLLPNEENPSDHLPLIAKFVLT